MCNFHLFRAIVLKSILLGCFFLIPTGVAHAEWDYLGVVSIYNKSNITIKYQLRAQQNGTWSNWKTRTHTKPNGGCYWHSFGDVDRIQIRFDCIGGDGEYTEKIYNLQFNRVDPNCNICRHKGRPYVFQFDRGGRLLDLRRYGW